MQRQQQDWKNELEARILLVEVNQKAINETITEQHDRVRHLSEIQNITQTTFREANRRTTTVIRNMSSDFRRLQDETRYNKGRN